MNAISIGTLVDQLSAIELVLGQTICNQYRDQHRVSLVSIAERWSWRAGDVTEFEWVTGANALIALFRAAPESDSEQAIALLFPTNEMYAENVRMFRGPGRPHGKLVNQQVYDTASLIRMERFMSDSNVHRATSGTRQT